MPCCLPSAQSRHDSSQSGTVSWYKRTDTLKQQSFVSRRDNGDHLQQEDSHQDNLISHGTRPLHTCCPDPPPPEGRSSTTLVPVTNLIMGTTSNRKMAPRQPYTKLRYSALHYTTLHYTRLNYATLHYTLLHYNTTHYTKQHYTTLDQTRLHTTTLDYTLI